MTRLQFLLLFSPLLLLAGAGAGIYVQKRHPEWKRSRTIFIYGALSGIVFMWAAMMVISTLDFGAS